MGLSETYSKALRDFEKLTNQQAATSKNKGSEEGLKRLKLLFKQGKTIQQRIDDFEAAVDDASAANTVARAKKELPRLETSRKKLSEGLKKNIDEFQTIAPFVTSNSASKTAYEIFIKRLMQLHTSAKSEAESRRMYLLETIGGSRKPTPDAKLISSLKALNLNLRSGIAETEALMKMFLEKPSEKTFKAAFTGNSGGPRTLTTATRTWERTILPKDPSLAQQLTVDPQALFDDYEDLANLQAIADWRKKFRIQDFSGTGWHGVAMRLAQGYLRQLGGWKKFADEVKALT